MERKIKNNDVRAVGKCSNAVCQVSCWHKKIIIRLFASSTRTANKIRLDCQNKRNTKSLNVIIEDIEEDTLRMTEHPQRELLFVLLLPSLISQISSASS